MKKLFVRIINSSCLLFAILSFILNFIIWLSSKGNQSKMLRIGANLIILLLCTIICMIFEYRKRKKERKANDFNKLIFIGSIVYTLSFYLLNTTQYIIKQNNFWNGYSLLIIVLFSFIVSFLIVKVKIKNYFSSSLLSYFTVGIFYYIFYVVKANYGKGTFLIISLTIYTLIFIMCSVTYYLVIKRKQKVENTEQPYKNLFS